MRTKEQIKKEILKDVRKQKLILFLSSMNKEDRKIWIDLYINGRINAGLPLPKNIRCNGDKSMYDVGYENTTPIRILNGKPYYVIGIPQLRNMDTGNFSGDYFLIKNPKYDFFFITYKASTGQAIKGHIVPKEVVVAEAQPKRNKKTKYPIFIISMDVVRNWQNYPDYSKYVNK